MTAGSIGTSNLADGAVTSEKTNFPWQTWSPTITGFSAVPTNSVYRYKRIGNTVTLQVRQEVNGTSNATNFGISLPFQAATITNMEWHSACQITNNGITSVTPGIFYINSGATQANVYTNFAANTFANTGGKRVGFADITYECVP